MRVEAASDKCGKILNFSHLSGHALGHHKRTEREERERESERERKR